MNYSRWAAERFAGTTYPINRDMVAEQLGMQGIMPEQSGRRIRPRLLHRACKFPFDFDGASFPGSARKSSSGVRGNSN